jgi:hypothetical protein
MGIFLNTVHYSLLVLIDPDTDQSLAVIKLEEAKYARIGGVSEGEGKGGV